MKRILYLIILFFILICGCNNSNKNNQHIHTYDIEWNYDEEYHYHQANCGHDEINDKTEHRFDEEIIEEANHFETGEVLYTCLVCGYFKYEEIEKIEHNFSEYYKFNETR